MNTPESAPKLPKITLVTPSFNQAEFLELTIRSVLSQAYPRLEYIILDGGSTDGSVEIIRNYESQLAYWHTQRDGGQGAAILDGWRRGTGELIGWINSDDLLLPGSLHAVGHAFSRRWDVYYGDDITIDRAGRVTHYALTAAHLDWALRNDFASVGQPGTFYSRRLAERVGYFDPRLKFAMEYDLFLNLMKAGGRARHVRVPTGALRLYEDTKTARNSSVMRREIEEVSIRVLPPAFGTLSLRRLMRKLVRLAMLGRYANPANARRLATKLSIQARKPNVQQLLEAGGAWSSSGPST